MHKTTRFLITVLALMMSLSCVSAVNYEGRFARFVPKKTLADDWYGISFTGTKVGWDHMEIVSGDLNGDEVIRVRDEGKVLYRMEEDKKPMEFTTRGEAFLSADKRLLGFTYDQSIRSHDLSIVGEAKEGTVYVDVTSGGGTQHIKFDDLTYPSTALAYFTLTEDISPGKTYTYRVFLEGLRLVEDMKVTVKDEEEVAVAGGAEKAYRVEGKLRKYTVTSFVKADGRVVKEITMDNFVAIRQTKEEAMTFDDSAGLSMYAIIDYSLVTPNRPIPDPERVSELTVRITGIPTGLAPISGGAQGVVGPDEKGGYRYIITRPDIDRLSVPAYGAFPKEVGEYLLPSLEIESTDKKMADMVRKIVGKSTDPRTDAKKIVAWVYKNVDKKMVDTTSALDTLISMEGECQAHANLAAALLRAAGIPTKIVSGIVYSEDVGAFLYHSWDEIYLGKWVPVDATFGQFPADVTHIEFTEGGPESVIDTIPLVGSIRLEVLEIKHD